MKRSTNWVGGITHPRSKWFNHYVVPAGTEFRLGPCLAGRIRTGFSPAFANLHRL